MNKYRFVSEVSKRCRLSEYAVSELFNVTYEIIAEELIHGESIDIPKIGSFVINRKNAKNLFGAPDDRTELCIYPSFKICRRLRERVKDGCKCQKAPGTEAF